MIEFESFIAGFLAGQIPLLVYCLFETRRIEKDLERILGKRNGEKIK